MLGTWTPLQKFTAMVVGAASGTTFYVYKTSKNERRVYNSWTTNTSVSADGKWDYNWDHRQPESLVKPISKRSISSPEEENEQNERLENVRSKYVRHIILVRHGEYLVDKKKDAERVLTDVGRTQADYTGKRLRALDIKWDKIYVSTLVRAQQTAEIICSNLNNPPCMENDKMIVEGAPIPPDPPIGHWKPEKAQFFQDGARIEAAFRRYFHRAEGSQKSDTYTLIVGHGNVIRYFICRALQIPPEAWLRMSLNHASITWISILPSGQVTIRTVGDSGHIPAKLVTHK